MHTCMHANHHAKLGTDRACRKSTVPSYAPHRPPSSQHHYCMQKDIESKLMAQPTSRPIKRHVGFLSRSSTLRSPLACLLSLYFPRVYRIRSCARAGLDRHHMTRWAAHKHPLALFTLPVVFSLLLSLPLSVPSHSWALWELSHDVQQAWSKKKACASFSPFPCICIWHVGPK
jgi:hypothetical protein